MYKNLESYSLITIYINPKVSQSYLKKARDTSFGKCTQIFITNRYAILVIACTKYIIQNEITAYCTSGILIKERILLFCLFFEIYLIKLKV